MNVESGLLMAGLVRWAVGKNPSNPTIPLEGIVAAILENGFQEGRFLAQVNEAGGTVQFTAFPGCGPEKIIALCEEALIWIGQQPDITNLRLNPRRIMRMKSDFGGYKRSWDAWFDRLVARSGRGR